MDKIRVLIVDDEEDFVETVVKRLKDRGLDAVGAGGGLEALQLCESREFDVVVLDVKMPRMDGIATLKELKKKSPLTEVIMLTGHGSVDSGVKGLQLGAYNYIMKPTPLDELLKQISQAYERKVIEMERAGSE
ncbi:MAG: response regulator [Thermodesulfobacteriota bacterium]